MRTTWRSMKRALLPAAGALAMLATAMPAQAFNSILNNFNSTYPGSSSGANASCQLCHGGGTNNADTGELNQYGFDLQQANRDFAAIEGNASVNVNGGSTYLDEINASTQPGWTSGANNSVYDTGNGNLISDTRTAPGGIGTLDPAAANSPPVAVADSDTTDEDSAVTIDVLANDTDADADTLTVDSVTQPNNGTVVNNGANVTYTPDANFNGTDSFTYVASDGTDLSDPALVEVSVTAVNDAPVAVDDSYSTEEDTPLSVPAPGVLGNDSDVDEEPLSAVLDTGPASGTLTLNGDGSFTYTPDAGFAGTDGFDYVANDGQADSNVAAVSITVQAAANNPPVANDDSLTTDEDTAGTVDVLANDSDPDGDTLTVSGVGTPANGTAVNNGDGTVTYTPNLNFNGSDSFTYTLSDGVGGSASATVSVTVTAVNDAPVANDDAATTAEDTAVSIDVLANDSDVDGDTLTVASVTDGASGTVTNNGTDVTYTPNAGFTGADSFSYSVSDGNGGTASANVSVTVTAVNNPPVATDDAATTAEDTAVSIDVLANDTDADGDTLSVGSVTQGANGTVTNNGGDVTYTPNLNFNGTDSFTYTASDGIAASAPATVSLTVTAVNDAPIADANGPYSATEGSAITFDGSGSSDPDNDVLSFAWDFGDGNTGSGVSPTHTYAATGAYTVSLTVNDGALSDTDITTATVSPASAVDLDIRKLDVDKNFNFRRRRPEPIEVELKVRNRSATDGTATATIVGVQNAVEVYSQTMTVSDPPGRGSTEFEFPSFTPSFGGDIHWSATLADGDPDEDTATATTRVRGGPTPPAPPVGDPPTGRGDVYSTPVGTPLDVVASRLSGVLYNDFDPDGDDDLLTAQLVSGPGAGSLVLNPDGSFSYTPDAALSDNDTDQFTYQARDADGNLSEPTKVVLQVLSKQTDFKILMNYELGMHCTGFEFAYCCVLPPYNSILAQVVKPAKAAGGGGGGRDGHERKRHRRHDAGDHEGDRDGHDREHYAHHDGDEDRHESDERDGGDFADAFPRLLEADPVNGVDGLNRPTVLRDPELDANGEFKKYQLRYYHDAQPRQEGNTSKPNTSTLISDAEGNSLQYFNTIYDSACVNVPPGDPREAGACDSYDPTLPTNDLVTGTYNGVPGAVLGDGDLAAPTDNYANGWLNHLYIYGNLEGHDGTGLEADKLRLGVTGQVAYPPNSGAALQPLGPTGNGAFENLLTFSGDTGTVVFTQAKVLEDLPITLTSPRIWEALGLPLTPFEDTIDFFGDPGAVDEDAIRPYVAMKASLHEYPSGDAVIGSNGKPVIGFGTAPIDIPNCERCHSAPSINPDTGMPNVNSPNWVRASAFYPHGGPLAGTGLEDMTNLEINFWLAYYDIVPGVDSTWYPRLKGAAINMLTLHDFDVGTAFTAGYAGVECAANPDPAQPPFDADGCTKDNGLADLSDQSSIPQNTRLGHESVICQKCHADNVIAVVKSAGTGSWVIPPISEALHNQHRNASEGGVIVFNDSLGRDGGCQGCHPAHRSDGVMDNYPITLGGENVNADGDNRLNPGGCFVGRDVHSNPMKDVDGAETPSHLNAVGDWLLTNVAQDQGEWRGIWCTNCHSQLGQELWRAEDCDDLVRGDCVVNPRGEPTLAAVAAAVGLSEAEAIDYLDPKVGGFDRSTDMTHAVWNPAIADASVATIEVAVPGSGASCGPLTPVFNPTFGVDVCVSLDADGDPSVNILSFCTTDDCVAQINDPAKRSAPGTWRHPESGAVDGVAGFAGTGTVGAAVPFSAATDGRDHWLAAGEPHCADCHKAPYVEQSGNINAFAPFNYPAKASLMRYSRGHQDITCQGCHESIHGLYPVSPTIDTTSYAQAAALNHDDSHGPLKCGSCHTNVDGNGIPVWVDDLTYTDPNTGGQSGVAGDFDKAVSWAHTYTDEANPLNDVCTNCHEDESDEVSIDEEEWLEHAMKNRVSRGAMDKAEIAASGSVFGSSDGADGVCLGCHGDESDELASEGCDVDGGEWKRHLIEGRVSESVWVHVSQTLTGSTCGW